VVEQPDQNPEPSLVRNRPGETPLSPDGRHYWDGEQWLPVPWAQASPAPPACPAPRQPPTLRRRVGRDALLVAIGVVLAFIALYTVMGGAIVLGGGLHR